MSSNLQSQDITNIPAKRNRWQMERDAAKSERLENYQLTISYVLMIGLVLVGTYTSVCWFVDLMRR